MQIPSNWEALLRWPEKFSPKQCDVIKAFGNKFIIVLVAANGVGKTLLLVWNFLAMLLGNHPYSKEMGKLGVPPIKARISAPTWDHNIMSVVVPKIRELCPRDALKRDFSEAKRTFYFRNASTLELMTYEQMVSQHASHELDLVGFDEQPPRNIWIEDMERLRSAKDGGRCFIGMTQELDSPRPITWMLEELWYADNPDIAKFTMSKFDLMGYHPNYTKEYFEREKRKYGEGSDEYKVKILGQFVSVGGLVYGADFKDATQPIGHLVSYFPPSLKWDYGMAIDSHARKPTAALWYAKDPDGNLFIIEELKRSESEGKTIREVAEIMHLKEKGWPIDTRLIGESATSKDNRIRPDWSEQEEFARWGFYCQPVAERPLAPRINAVKQYLKSDGSDYPELRVFEHCHDLRHDMKHVVYEEFRHKEEKDPKMKVKDKWKCLPNCLEHICQHEGRFVEDKETETIVTEDFLPRFQWNRGLSTGAY